jgi:hypothetical protein
MGRKKHIHRNKTKEKPKASRTIIQIQLVQLRQPLCGEKKKINIHNSDCVQLIFYFEDRTIVEYD